MIRRPHFLSLVRDGQFIDLFITELGWNRYRGQASLPTITVDDMNYNIETIAERNGFQILYCIVDELPKQAQAKKIDTKLRRQAQDYILIFRKHDSSAHDLWVVPIRTNEKRDLVMSEYDNGNAEAIYQKIEGITFELGEKTNIVDLRAKVQKAFSVNSEKITKDFYKGFKKQHQAFAEFITGIDDHIDVKNNRNKQWYTSVILNRLMFCYFIQKKGFLNFETDYLRKKLEWVRMQEGEDRFYNFYRSFLCQLFSDGLNSPRHSKEFSELFGRIPYLNGGMFDRHQLEKEYPEIDIPDEAFTGLFDFFDKWNWHLDTRITASGKDINPDVLGYIFEQYINDRAQMGAYYTKEDITEYIGRNCILPFLFDTVGTSRAMSDYFKPNGFVWQRLRCSGDRYIFDAVKKGYKEFADIPDEIKRGIIADAMRKEYAETPIGELPDDHVPLSELRSEWNRPTPEPWGLPTEIWRETIERLQRCEDILHKIERGEITSINDFITYNLDIRNFALDLLASADSVFVKHFYHALQKVSILDPTCGSGAFLFAAMNILEPLYEICIERMQEFNRQSPAMFKAELAEITDKYRSNIQYFIFKSIILRNLYGVDIMVEATEIAKLRLFLKMVAVVDVDRRADNLGLDPLPDIDFNIRCGNTLVGYANREQLVKDLDHPKNFLEELANQEFKEKINNELKTVSRTYEIFKDIQLRQEEDMVAFKQAKINLVNRLNSLNSQLNQRNFLATTGYQLKPKEDLDKNDNYIAWLASHQPFNWLSEFYQIIQGNGGFDVIIGNPPYVEYNKKNKETGRTISDLYKVNCSKTLSCSNLYAFVIERCFVICNPKSNVSLIVPMSIITTERMQPLREIILDSPIYTVLINLAGDWHPGRLFEGVRSQFTIVISIGAKTNVKTDVYTTDYIRWYNKERDILFKTKNKLTLNKASSKELIYPKFGNVTEDLIYSKVKNFSFLAELERNNGCVMHYRNAGIAYYNIAITFEQLFSINGVNSKSSTLKDLYFSTVQDAEAVCAIFNSSIFALLYFIFSDCYHLTKKDLARFRFPKSSFEELIDKNMNLMQDINKNSINKITEYKTKGTVTYQEFYPRLSKPIIDEIDKVLAKHYGFTDEELDFIINYDIKYRMGDELSNEHE